MMWRRYTVGLLMICGSLALITWLRLERYAPSYPVRVDIPSASDSIYTAATSVAQADVPLADLSESIARPLFSRTRRPEVISEVTEITPSKKPTKTKPPMLQLLGIVEQANRFVALVKIRGNTKSIRVALGDTVDGWEVLDIGRRELKLGRDGNEVSMKISRLSDKRKNTRPNNNDHAAQNIKPKT